MSSKTIKGLIFVVFVLISALVAVVVFYETREDDNDIEVIEAENMPWKESTTRESMTTKTSSNEPLIGDGTTYYLGTWNQQVSGLCFQFFSPGQWLSLVERLPPPASLGS